MSYFKINTVDSFYLCGKWKKKIISVVIHSSKSDFRAKQSFLSEFWFSIYFDNLIMCDNRKFHFFPFHESRYILKRVWKTSKTSKNQMVNLKITEKVFFIWRIIMLSYQSSRRRKLPSGSWNSFTFLKWKIFLAIWKKRVSEIPLRRWYQYYFPLPSCCSYFVLFLTTCFKL